MGKLIRRFLVWVFGVPVCDACSIHNLYCTGFCGMTDKEREKRYIEGIADDEN